MRIKEPKETCRLTQGKKTCAFLSVGPDGFECLKGGSVEKIIRERLSNGTMVAKGEGDWKECLNKAV